MKSAFVAIVLASCTFNPLPPPKPVPIDPTGEATCSTACDRAREIGCSWASPTPEGASCETVCNDVMHTAGVHFNLSCRTGAADCFVADGCED